jgi:hypothetical protein
LKELIQENKELKNIITEMRAEIDELKNSIK